MAGTYFTAMEGSLRAPFIIRWPGKVPAGRVNNEIVHIVDLFTTLARVGGAEVPKDRPIDGVDQMDFFLGKQETSNREGFPAYVADRLSAVKWRNWKVHLIWQENMYAPPQKLPLPKIINLLTDRKEERDVAAYNSWVADPAVRIIGEFEAASGSTLRSKSAPPTRTHRRSRRPSREKGARRTNVRVIRGRAQRSDAMGHKQDARLAAQDLARRPMRLERDLPTECLLEKSDLVHSVLPRDDVGRHFPSLIDTIEECRASDLHLRIPSA